MKPALARRSWWRWGRKFGIAAVVWVVACEPALAEDTGNGLLEACLKLEEPFARGYCGGFVAGAGQALQWGASDICLPAGVTLGQMSDVAVRYLQAHPEIRHHPAVALVRAALFEAFPCPR